jgi:hypothetical protein
LPRSCPSTGGCPIRRSSDHRVPAPPRRVSSRGHVLRRPLTPRHPPCALLSGFPACSLPSSWCARRAPTSGSPTLATPVASLLRLSMYLRRGAAGIRTPDLRRAKAALSQLSYGPLCPRHRRVTPTPVGAPGLEPGTSALSGPRSNHLSYAPGACRHAFRLCAEDEADPKPEPRSIALHHVRGVPAGPTMDAVHGVAPEPVPTPAASPRRSLDHREYSLERR